MRYKQGDAEMYQTQLSLDLGIKQKGVIRERILLGIIFFLIRFFNRNLILSKPQPNLNTRLGLPIK